MGTLEDFKTIMDLVVAGELNPILDSTFPLEEAAAAQKRLWNGMNFGKITLVIG